MKNVLNRPCQKVFLLILVILLLTTSYPGGAIAKSAAPTLSRVYPYPTPTLGQVTVDGQTYDTVTLPDGSGARAPGEPDLSSLGASLLLPQGTAVASIDVDVGTPTSLGTGFHVMPVRVPVKLSEIDTASPALFFDSSIYDSADAFPASLLADLGIQSFRGYDLLELALSPVQYLPASGTLLFYPSLTVTVHLQQAPSNPLYRGRPDDEALLRTKVDNPETITSYPLATSQPVTAGSYSLLILTTDALKSHFQPLMDAHNAQGLPTEIKTLSDISPHPGTATGIRDFIRDEYITNGIQYVLIGGDDDVVPAQPLYVQAWEGGDHDQMPSDLFYECLDGTYDYNGNGVFGETHDGPGGHDVDLIGEVSVGRACVGDATEADIFVQKTVAYLQGPGITTGPCLMVGEYLWENPDTFGDDYMEEIVNGSHAHSYTTVGIPASQYNISRLYDRLWGYPPGWPSNELIRQVNAGVKVINHLGHSDWNYNMRIVNDDVDWLTNTVLPFIYSQGCYAGAFDYDDSIAEHWTVKTANGAFAVIMCARYGWGVVGSTDGANQRFHRYFWDAVFGKNITAIERANQASKEGNVHRINGSCMRWVYYEMNLFGDPALEFFPIQNSAPVKPAAPKGTTQGNIKTNYVFNASTTDPDGDKIYYKFSFGDGTFSAWLGPYASGTEAKVSHNWSKRGTYNVQVRAMDTHYLQSDWSDPLPVKMPYRPHWLDVLHQIIAFLLHLLIPS